MFELSLFYGALAFLAAQFAILATIVYARSVSRSLPQAPPAFPGAWPRVSILIAACNEEAEIETALQSVLRLDYPDYEVIVVNDRSTDGTGAILARVQEQHPRLQIVAIDALPPGWLGKNHALHRSAQQAAGELLLFTDADIVFDPLCLRRAVGVLQAERLDHLTLSPEIKTRSFWINLLVPLFMRNFTLFVKPWKARDPKASHHIGLGAFNLVRTTAYRQVGGHEKIRLRPDDDLKLGKLLKQAGFRQDVWHAPGNLSLEWYPSLGAMTRGLEKNVLAGLDYRLGVFVASILTLLTTTLAPWALLLVGDDGTRLAAAAAALTSMLSYALFFPLSHTPWLFALLEPLASLTIVYIFARSGLLTLWRGGIAWRGTFYALTELRRNQV